MVRSIWIGPPVIALVLTVGAWGLPSAPVPAARPGERVITVQEQNKPAQPCRVVHSWRMTDGTRAYQVQALDTGEMMTIVESGPLATPPSQGRPRIRAIATRIYHWGRSPRSPAGVPQPPAEMIASIPIAERLPYGETRIGPPDAIATTPPKVPAVATARPGVPSSGWRPPKAAAQYPSNYRVPAITTSRPSKTTEFGPDVTSTTPSSVSTYDLRRPQTSFDQGPVIAAALPPTASGKAEVIPGQPAPVVSTVIPCGPCDPCKVCDPCYVCDPCKPCDPCDPCNPCKKRKSWLWRFWSREKCKPCPCDTDVTQQKPVQPTAKPLKEQRPVVKAPLAPPQPRDFRESWGKPETVQVEPKTTEQQPVVRTPAIPPEPPRTTGKVSEPVARTPIVPLPNRGTDLVPTPSNSVAQTPTPPSPWPPSTNEGGPKTQQPIAQTPASQPVARTGPVAPTKPRWFEFWKKSEQPKTDKPIGTADAAKKSDKPVASADASKKPDEQSRWVPFWRRGEKKSDTDKKKETPVAQAAPESRPGDWGSTGRKVETPALKDVSARTKPPAEGTLPHASTPVASDPLSHPSDYAKQAPPESKTPLAPPSSVPDTLPDPKSVMGSVTKPEAGKESTSAVAQAGKKEEPENPPGSGSVLAAGNPQYIPVPIATMPPPPMPQMPSPPQGPVAQIPQAPQPNQGHFGPVYNGSPPSGFRNAFTNPGPERPVPAETIPPEATRNAFSDVVEGQGTLPLPVSPLVSHLPRSSPPQGYGQQCPPMPPMQGAPMQAGMQPMPLQGFPPQPMVQGMPAMPMQPMGAAPQAVPGVAWMPVQGRFVPANYFPIPQGYPVNVYAGYGMMNPAMAVGYQQPVQSQVDPQNNVALLLQMLRESDYPSQREWAADQLTIQRGQSNPQVVNALLTAAKDDPAPLVRACCVRCLTKMQVQTVPVANVLQQLQEDTDPRVRDAVTQALTAMGIVPTKKPSPVQPASSR